MASALAHPELIHPSLWRASQLALSGGVVGVDTGYPALSAELPGGGWPPGALIKLMTQQPGIGEVRLLAPVLARFAKRPVIVVQPPHCLQPAALAYWRIDPSGFVMLRAPKTADDLWAAEQALRVGTCSAVLLWQQAVRTDALRRLNLAAQAGNALFFLFRPASAAQNASPAPLRLGLAPRRDGIDVTSVKRRGAQRDTPLFVPLSPSPILFDSHGSLDKRASAAPNPRVVPAERVRVAVE
ncbi:translesion DNA synthesis-associated protein ImuA [Burkholderia gladioli]|uniref:translesion DNA synthesis-associated protein ImuA n=1 Tax=Burkholderia gladioli TaxID=28095 RepID=UPI001916E9A4|nr:translesion DNA synthesis-associated protein ImuA [Burkholderia gladioli]MDN7600371.1 translesion DNA synthesis-associated protein ImuA [Burkholderia gladioli]